MWGQIEPEPSFDSFEQTLAELQFAPDGCALDAEGCIWSADAVGGRVARLAPGGEIVDDDRRRRRASACSPACSAARTAARC